MLASLITKNSDHQIAGSTEGASMIAVGEVFASA
jgi:hypothetical protein